MNKPMDGGRGTGRGGHHAPPGPKTKAAPKGSLAGLLIVAVLVLAGAGGLIWWETQASGPAPTANGGIGGPFAMVDQAGKPVDQSILKGKGSAVFFGYTYCPDVCPATLQALGGAYKRLGDKGRDFQTVFVTVDPDRDHPEQMRAYIDAQALPMRTLGLTGSPAQVAAIAKAYKVYYARAGTGANYAMDHSAAIYLMDPAGRFVAPLTHEMAPDKIAAEILRAEGRS